MLVLTRKRKQALQIGDDITVHVVRIDGDKVRLAVDAPDHVKILRTELLRKVTGQDAS